MHLKTENFDGPLSLLLDLIEKKKLPIGEVSLADIALQFLDFVKKFENFPVADAASFIETASILMLIKSRSLLPQLELSDEEEENIGDLERRLAAYKFIRELSEGIKKIYGKNPMFGRESFVNFNMEGLFLPPSNLSLSALVKGINDLMNSFPQEQKLPEARVEKIVKLEEKIAELANGLQRKMEMCFSEFSGKGRSGDLRPEEINRARTEIIVSFLALLELVKQGAVMANQNQLFEEISMSRYSS
ncbi:hypothetical protein C4572_04040 [Candidatus Parcubacteria bacterium]|nr:MAG: hypothetical protein C4572_04040 [Candidatus Parcubacteria bacterium]